MLARSARRLLRPHPQDLEAAEGQNAGLREGLEEGLRVRQVRPVRGAENGLT